MRVMNVNELSDKRSQQIINIINQERRQSQRRESILHIRGIQH